MQNTQIPEHPELHEPWSEEMAEWYTEKYGEHACNHTTVELADVKPDDFLLDIGCGSGTAVREAASVLVTGQAIGVDFSPAMVAIATEKTKQHAQAQRIRFLLGEAGALPVSDGSQTVVTAINSFHHWRDPKAGLAEVVRVLAKNGRLVICEEIFGEERGPNHTMDARSLSDLLEKSGFSVTMSGVRRADDVDVTVAVARKTT